MRLLRKSLVMEIKIFDNFLSSFQFDSIQSFFMGNDVPWFWGDSVVYENEPGDDYKFFNTIYRNSTGPNVYYPLIEPCITRLGCSSVTRVRANLRPKTLFHRKTPYHTDYPEPVGNEFTSIFYINTNNGWTEFKNIGKVKSVANRMVVFPCVLEHRGVSCTDQMRRVVLNFNYEKY